MAGTAKIGVFTCGNTDNFIHAALIDTTNSMLYLARIQRDPSLGNGPVISIIKVDISTGANEFTIAAAKHYDVTGGDTRAQIQGMAQDATYVYVFFDAGGAISMTQFVAKFAKSTLAASGTGISLTGTYSQQGHLYNDAWGTSSLWHVGGQNILGDCIIWRHNTADNLANERDRRWRINTNGAATGIDIAANIIRDGNMLGAGDDDGAWMYVCGAGTRNNGVNTRAAVAFRVKQVKDGSYTNLDPTTAQGISLYPNVMTDWPEVSSITLEAGIFDLAFDSANSDVIWACGNIPKTGGASGADGLLVRIDRNATGTMAIDRAWRFHHSSAYVLRFSGITEDTNYLYLSSTYVKHNNLGDDNEQTQPAKLYILKLEKAKLNNADDEIQATAITFAISFDKSSGAGQSHALFHSISLNAAGNTLYVGGDTTVISGFGLGDPFLLKLPIAPDDTSLTYRDANQRWKQMSEAANITITNLKDPSDTVTFGTDVPTLEVETTGWAAATKTWNDETWTPISYSVNQTSMVTTLYPISDANPNEANMTDNDSLGAGHYKYVDPQQGANSYIQMAGSEGYSHLHTEMFHVTNSGDPGGSITNVRQYVTYSKVNNTTSACKFCQEIIVDPHGTPAENYGAEQSSLVYQIPPATQNYSDWTMRTGFVAWTWGDLAVLHAGFYLKTGPSGIAGRPACGETYLVVTWEPYPAVEKTENATLSETLDIAASECVCDAGAEALTVSEEAPTVELTEPPVEIGVGWTLVDGVNAAMTLTIEQDVLLVNCDTDGVTAADVLGDMTLIHNPSIEDSSLSISETLTITMALADVSPAAENVAVSETRDQVTTIENAPSITEAIAVSETNTQVTASDAGVSLAENIAAGEDAAVFKVQVADPAISLTENSTVSETREIIKVFCLDLSENSTISETLTVTLVHLIDKSEAVDINDAVTFTGTFIVALLENIDISETSAVSKAYHIDLSENVDCSETLTVIDNIFKMSLAETVAASEALACGFIWYVDPAAADGTGVKGNSDFPYKYLAGIATSLGDSILFKANAVIQENAYTLTAGGNSAHSLLLGKYGSGDDPLFNLPVGQAWQFYVPHTSGGYVDFQNLRFTGGSAGTGNRFVYIYAGHDISFTACTFASSDKEAAILIFNNRSDMDCYNILIDQCNFRDLTGSGENEAIRLYQDTGVRSIFDVTVRNSTFWNVGSALRTYLGTIAGPVAANHNPPYGIIFEDNNIIATYRYALLHAGLRDVANHPSSIRRNNFFAIGNPSAANVNALQLAWCDGLVVEDNVIDLVRTSVPDGHGVILDWAWGASGYLSNNVTVRRNIIHGCTADVNKYSAGIANANCSAAKIYNNYVYDCGCGIRHTGPYATAAEYYNNALINNLRDGICLDEDAASHQPGAAPSAIRNNILAYNSCGIAVRHSSSLPVTETNNCFYENRDAA